jgi:hypothetical protein
MTTSEQATRHPARCPVCDWLMAPSLDEGCVPGNCCYRPTEGSSEYRRVEERKRGLQQEEREGAYETTATAAYSALQLLQEERA